MWPAERDEKIQDRCENRRHIFVILGAPLCGRLLASISAGVTPITEPPALVGD
jgi:hypothetical protein